jgi:hypothetical protein
MRRSGLAVTAAVMLSMVPAAPPAFAAPISFNPAVVTSESGSVIEVSHRRKHRRHCHRDVRNHGGGWHKHGKHCRTIFVRRHHRHHHHRFGGACFRFEGITLCFN